MTSTFFYGMVETVSREVKGRFKHTRVTGLESQQLKRPQTSKNVAAHQIYPLQGEATDQVSMEAPPLERGRCKD